MIKNIVFDIGNVLVDFRWRELLKEYGVSEEDIDLIGERAFGTGLWSQLDLGERAESDVIEEIARSLGEKGDRFMLLFEHAEELVRPFPGNREWMKRLKKEGFRIYLLSNYPRDLFLLHEEKCFDFMDLIDGKVVSAFERMIKPEESIYRCLIDRYGLVPEESAYLDDLPANAAAAAAAGMKAIVVKDRAQAMEDLDKCIRECSAE